LNVEQVSQLQPLLQAPPKATGLEGSVWTQARIAHLVRERFGISIRPQNIHRMLKRRNIRVTHGASRGGQSPLNAEQIGLLAQALSLPPTASGVDARRWTRSALAAWIQTQFGVRYATASVSALLRRHGLQRRQSRARSTAEARPAINTPISSDSGVTHCLDIQPQ
jgi:transposase